MTPSSRTPSPRHCSVAGALDVIGEKWSLLVIRELLLGNRRFNDIADKTGAPRDILTARLRKLEELGVIERRLYSEKPARHMYVLTQAGKDLQPVMMALKHWGDVHVMHEHLAPVLEHSCGAVFEPRTHCASCGEPLDGRDLTRVDAASNGTPTAPADSQGVGRQARSVRPRSKRA